MKRFYLLFIIAAMATGLTAQNLVLNPGFEDWDDPTHPTSWTQAESVEQESAAENLVSGTYSAKQTGGRSDLTQLVSVTPGKTYTLSLWFKVLLEDDGDDVRIWSGWKDGADWLSADADVLHGPDGGYFTNSADWQQYSVEVTAPDTATHMNIEMRTYGTAVVVWDDFVFEEVIVLDTPEPIFFSEYIEGTSNNRAFEIYNPTSEVVDLSDYQIAQASGGGGWQYYHVFPEGATIEPYDVWVLMNSGTSTALFDPADADEVMSWPSPVHHTGDDARAIVFISATDTTIIDLIGDPDSDPGDGWPVAGITEGTYNHTIVRKDATTTGTDDWALSAGTDADDSQWKVYGENEFSYLGWHGPDMIVPKVAFTPAEGAVSVSVSSDILITFNEPIANVGGSEITDPSGLLVLKDTDADGTDVAFTASINADKDTITITPDAALAYETLYYVALSANLVEDSAANALVDLQSSTFTTIGPLEVTYPTAGIVFYPGQDVHIDWTTDLTEDLSIWVSFDGGVNFDVEAIVTDIDPTLGTVDYSIPEDSPASMECVIRMSKTTDVTFVDVIDDSEEFNIVPMLSINDIQSDLAGMYTDTICLTTGIVVYANGTSEYYISDGTGDYSGVVVRDNVNKPAVGDSVVIAGKVVEYYELTQINNLISYNLAASGKPVPDPIDVTTGGAGETSEGVIVVLSSAVVLTEANGYGEVEVDDGTGVILVDDPYYLATLVLGASYNITGPLSYGYDTWRVFPRTAADIVYVESNDSTVTSDVYTVDNVGDEITGVPALEELAAFKANITVGFLATFEVYESDGSTVATDLATGYKVTVTAEDGSMNTYTIIKETTISDNATVTSVLYTVDDGAETIDGVMFKSSVESLGAALLAAPGASFVLYLSDGTTVATDVLSGYKLIVTAEDATTKKTYTLAVDDALPGELFFSEYIEPDGGNSKALEIFNPNDEAVRLDYYQIGQMHNGDNSGDEAPVPAGWWEYYHVFPVGATIEAKAVYVMVTADTDDALFLKSEADEVLEYADDSPVFHTGDDARSLLIVTGMDTTVIDIIGALGPDPGSGWDVAGVTDATMNHTLVRKGTVMEGNANWALSAGTNADDSEWIVYDANFWDSLGVHTLVLPQPSDDATLSALMVDGSGVAGFSPALLTYAVSLDAGTTTVPTVTATATDGDLADVAVTPATDLGGDEAARTTTVTVTAEDDETIKNYTIVFTVEVGIENSRFSDVRVYPVPAASQLYIENIEMVETITVFDITGSAVMNINHNRQAKLTLDISSLNSGLYTVRMTGNEATGIVRFIKK